MDTDYTVKKGKKVKSGTQEIKNPRIQEFRSRESLGIRNSGLWSAGGIQF